MRRAWAERDAAAVVRLVLWNSELSQTKLSQILGVSQSTISEAVSGKSQIARQSSRDAVFNGLDILRPPVSPKATTELTVTPQVIEPLGEVQERLEIASIDWALIGLFEAQTQNLRLIDRKLGAHYLLAQSQAHVQQMHDLLLHSLPSAVRRGLARALAEAASLTGWQALDSGRSSTAWRYYEIAKAAARESGDATVLAHVSAEQVYVLLDSGREYEALAALGATRDVLGASLPALLSSWLWAAEGEVHAALGRESETQRALECAFALLPSEPHDPSLPFLMLDHTHLLRWRGHCLARLGHGEAIEDLTRALDSIAPLELGRAEAGLRTDLALAYTAHGDTTQARRQVERAAELSDKSGSVRQRTRLARLLPLSSASGGEDVEQGDEGT
ncbi:XRE family transcriptional regulator [Nocardiopsis alborubida]|nr:XRE family transcriptional regulator [Nocardiopsis alborubida]